jgi:hypothetical protein
MHASERIQTYLVFSRVKWRKILRDCVQQHECCEVPHAVCEGQKDPTDRQHGRENAENETQNKERSDGPRFAQQAPANDKYASKKIHQLKSFVHVGSVEMTDDDDDDDSKNDEKNPCTSAERQQCYSARGDLFA